MPIQKNKQKASQGGWKKWLSGALICLLLCTGLSGCGSKDDAKSQAEEEASADRTVRASYLINDLVYRQKEILPINLGSYIEVEGIIRQIDAEQHNLVLVDKDNPQDEVNVVCHFKTFNADILAGDQVEVVGKVETRSGGGILLENCRVKVTKKVDEVNQEQAEKQAKKQQEREKLENELRQKIEKELREKGLGNEENQNGGNGNFTAVNKTYGYSFYVPEGYVQEAGQSGVYRNQANQATFGVSAGEGSLDSTYNSLLSQVPSGQLGYKDKGGDYYIVSYRSNGISYYERAIRKGNTLVRMQWQYPLSAREQAYPALLEAANSLKFN